MQDAANGDALSVITCNVRRCSFEHAQDVIEDLVPTPHSILCLQEVSSWPSGDSDEFKLPGWIAQHTADSPSAILVPRGREHLIRWMGSQCMHSMVLLGEVGIISSYLPDSWKSLDLYAKAVDELLVARHQLQQKGARTFIIGGDFQLELQPNLGELTGPQALGRATEIIGKGIRFLSHSCRAALCMPPIHGHLRGS